MNNIINNNWRWWLIVAILYIMTGVIQAKVVYPLEQRFLPELLHIASIMFLPHAVSVLSTVILGPRSFFALLPAMLLLYYSLFAAALGGLTSTIVFAAISSASCAPLSYLLITWLRRRDPENAMDPLNWRTVLLIGVVASLLNSAMRAVIYKEYYDFETLIAATTKVIMGDIVGLMVGLLILLFSLRLIKRGAI